MSRLRFVVALLCVLGSLLAFERFAHAAIYLQFDGVTGPSTDAAHKGWFELQSFVFATPAHDTTAEAGRATQAAKDTQISIVKYVDAASPKLSQSSAAGQHIKNATIDIVNTNANGVPQEVYRIVLTDCMISRISLSQGAGSNAKPIETVSINFTKMEVSYGKTDTHGIAARLDATAVKAGWDIPYRPRAIVQAQPASTIRER
jgi:type VI secretion system secreted protein Hcp